MIRATLLRSPSTDEGTFGTLQVHATRVDSFRTIELPWRDNSPQLSCIPAGAYRCRLGPTSKWSPRADGRLFEVTGVPGRSAIKIHAASWAGDVRKGLHADLLGCIAPGKTTGKLTPPDTGKPQAAVLSSRVALTELMTLLGDDDFELTVEWESAP